MKRMLYIELPQSGGDNNRRLPFYLAMEEYLAREVVAHFDVPLFFMWQVNPTVIIGRNQVAENEVNLAYCREQGIEVYRRKSGGGCVYADQKNIMMSYVAAHDGSVTETFEQYTDSIVEMLRGLGLDATSSSRNDVLISGSKVSGNAYYHLSRSSIVHGTMLYDADLEAMSKAITPSKVKLKAKGVESVRSRVTMLSRYLTMDIEEFKAFAREQLCSDTLVLSQSDVCAIEEIEKGYYSDDWIYRAKKPATPKRLLRIEGVGEIQATVATDSSGRISGLNLTGDFFLEEDQESLLIDRLRGVNYKPEDVVKAMEGFSVGNVISGLTNEQLIELLF